MRSITSFTNKERNEEPLARFDRVPIAVNLRLSDPHESAYFPYLFDFLTFRQHSPDRYSLQQAPSSQNGAPIRVGPHK
jgi:hypothetical protein